MTNTTNTSADPLRAARAGLTQLIEPAETMGTILTGLWGPVRMIEMIRGSHPTPAEWQKFMASSESGKASAKREKHFATSLARWRKKLDYLNPDKALLNMARLGGEFITPEDEVWPNALRDLGLQEPFGLWALGNTTHLAQLPALSIVGSREATPYGNEVVRMFVDHATEAGLSIVSGGAYGIDAAAHRSALEASTNTPVKTVAFLAGGLDDFYPVANRELLSTIVGHGTLLSEFPPGFRPTRYRFLNRNRLIAAMSQATIVVEARYRSGAISTAHHAFDLGRPVGVVPGPITSPSSAGCHRLLRDTPAQLVDDPADIDKLISSDHLTAPDTPDTVYDHLTHTETIIVEALPVTRSITVDGLSAKTGFSLPTVITTLQKLLLAGLAENTAVGWRIAPKPAKNHPKQEQL